jgi:hypothetical protein
MRPTGAGSSVTMRTASLPGSGRTTSRSADGLDDASSDCSTSLCVLMRADTRCLVERAMLRMSINPESSLRSGLAWLAARPGAGRGLAPGSSLRVDMSAPLIF